MQPIIGTNGKAHFTYYPFIYLTFIELKSKKFAYFASEFPTKVKPQYNLAYVS